ncbi:MAG: DUF945 family protein [Alcanivorax sp.]|uniref:DUF945 family protein n=1 Tax=Alcanivorax sp. TaxID=1872427 RepID=UPI0026118052|nr:DUF945 family protein [Alcanivorax sp.]MDF1724461.1 DUF945 family protein [Alcanivorax sp.]
MKKLVALILVLVVAWLGATFYVGMRAETLVREEVAGLEVIPGQTDIIFDVFSYDRGLFRSEAVACLIIQGEMASNANLSALSGKICSLSTIHHGPFAWTGDGLFVGIAASEEVLDLSGLPAEMAAMVNEIFQGKPPVSGYSRYGFDGSLTMKVAVAPVNLDSPMGKVVLEELQLDVLRPSADAYPVNSYLSLQGLDVSSPKMGFAVDSLTGSVDVVAMLGGELPLADINLTGKQLRWSQGELPMLAFDLTLQGTSQDHGETLSGNSRLWLEQIAGPMVPLPMDSAYLGMEYAGLDKQALVRVHALNREMDEIQTQALMGALSGNGEQGMEQQMMRIQTLLAEMTQVAAEQLLHPGDSELALQMLVDHQGERQLTLDSKARYLGLDGNNLSTQELMALSETEIQQMLDITVRVDIHDSLVPPPYAGRLTALAEQGVVERQGERWRGVINANGGILSLNGEPVSREQLEERLKAISGASADSEAAQGETVLDDPLAYHVD